MLPFQMGWPGAGPKGLFVDFLVNNWVLVLIALTSGALLAFPALTGGLGGPSIAPSEAVRLMNREKGVLIDVREPAEFAAGHPVGARNLPLATLAGAGKQLPSNKQTPLIISCATGARAGRAAAELRKMGYENVQVLGGGLGAWREAQLPTNKTA